MPLLDRVRRILVQPKVEWPVIATEVTSPRDLYARYIIPLALIPPICSLLSYGIYLHFGFIIGAAVAAVSFVLELVYVLVVALIADALAPQFAGVKDRIAALKWIAYSLTPRWVAGIALLIPIFGSIVSLLGSLYALYLLYLGASPVMRVPQERAVGYTVVLVIAVIVFGILVSVVVAAVVAALAITTAASLHALTR